MHYDYVEENLYMWSEHSMFMFRVNYSDVAIYLVLLLYLFAELYATVYCMHAYIVIICISFVIEVAVNLHL